MTKPDALKALANRVASVNDKSYKPAVDVTFEEFATKWQSTVLSQRKPSYRALEKSRLRFHLVPAPGRMKVGDIAACAIQEMIAKSDVGGKTKKNLPNLISTMNETASASDGNGLKCSVRGMAKADAQRLLADRVARVNSVNCKPTVEVTPESRFPTAFEISSHPTHDSFPLLRAFHHAVLVEHLHSKRGTKNGVAWSYHMM